MLQAGSPLGDRLVACCRGRQLNTAPLDATALATVLLPRLLPAAWQNQSRVEWRPPAEGSEAAPEASGRQQDPTRGHSQPSREWMQGLWGTLRDLKGFMEASAWPIIPVQGGLLCQPRLESAVSSPLI